MDAYQPLTDDVEFTFGVDSSRVFSNTQIASCPPVRIPGLPKNAKASMNSRSELKGPHRCEEI